eukprot:Gregarina_sp_Pseudo_9__5306@NODE_619_length_2478_cov_14_630586_g585_i0_p2_GENE_NODE_619_length_2478_cov_14_630586_g585_i0NODE_619_length_2478_cov_14_630586_g585_i0_p2_ORF_typecomplete_len221_score28_83DUF998/PF06197_13/11DUF998/PF06197_13/1_3_NODE_619_length_2478_cov_14_630586_g585_i0277939
MDPAYDVPWAELFSPQRRLDRIRAFSFMCSGTLISGCLIYSCLEASQYMTVLCSQALAISSICLGLPLDLLEIVESASALERLLFLTGLAMWVVLSPKSLAAIGASCAGLTIAGSGYNFPQPTRYEAELAMAVVLLASMSAFVMQTCFITVISANGNPGPAYSRQITILLLFACLFNVVLSLSVGIEIHTAIESLHQWKVNRYRKLRKLILSPRRIPPCA